MLSANDIKYYASLKQKKYRRENNQFLIEGFHLVEECLSSSFILEYIILRSGTDLSAHPGILDKISRNKTKVEPVSESAFNKLAETENSQGIIGVVSIPKSKTVKGNDKTIIALDRISDPGNLGTILRTAYWFNIQSVLLSVDSADVYNSKTTRSSQGGVFHTNAAEDVVLLKKLNELKKNGYNIYLLTPSARKNLNEAAQQIKNEKSVIVFGSEAHGISDELMNAGFEEIKIEGYSECESLNVAIACGIVLYEITKK